MLNIRVDNFALRLYVFESEVVGSLRRPQERRSVVWDETSLPSIGEILTGLADQIDFRDKCLIKPHHVAGRCPHANWVPPGFIDTNRWIGEIAGKHELCFQRGGIVPGAARPCRAHQQDGPMRPAGTGREGLVSVDNIASLNLFCRGAKTYGF